MATTERKVTPADDSQSERLHGFSHSIRNKITGLYEALRHIGTEQDARSREEIATYAEIQFYHALRETERLLDDLAVPRSVRLTVKEPVDLRKTVEKALQHVEDRVERKGQVFDAQLADGLVVTGDPYYLEEVVFALLTNASKFSQPGGRVRITLERDGTHAVLQVVDEGVGMTPDDLASIFLRFAWLSSRSTAGEVQGRSTLSKVRNWVEVHGGTITATSAGRDQGSSFTVRLPLAS